MAKTATDYRNEYYRMISDKKNEVMEVYKQNCSNGLNATADAFSNKFNMPTENAKMLANEIHNGRENLLNAYAKNEVTPEFIEKNKDNIFDKSKNGTSQLNGEFNKFKEETVKKCEANKEKADMAVEKINEKEAELKNQGKLDNKNETSINYQKNCVKAAGNLENHTASQFDIGKMRALTNESEKNQSNNNQNTNEKTQRSQGR